MDVLYYLLVSLIHTTFAQFPDHLDLQKVGEIIFNNENYNVLKPTAHKITDHFKDFMLRRENKKKDEKVFIDDNGFRHFWNGFGVKRHSLRKTDIAVDEINENIKSDNIVPITEENNDKTAKNEDNKKTNVENTTKIVKKKPKRPKTSREVDEIENAMLRQGATKPSGAKNPGAGRKVAITSFFCPFFGVITMTSFID